MVLPCVCSLTEGQKQVVTILGEFRTKSFRRNIFMFSSKIIIFESENHLKVRIFVAEINILDPEVHNQTLVVTL